MSGGNGLPKGWASARIGDIVHLVNGMAFKPSQWSAGGLPIIRIQNLNDPDATFNYCSEHLPGKFIVQAGDLLFAWSGTPGTSFGAHVWRGGEAWLNQHIFNVHFDRTSLHPTFLRYAINQNLDSYIRQAHGGAGLAHITKGRFEDSVLSIAPLPEQHRIVAKIEELFSDLDAGVHNLKRAKANLKRYRASVLKAAVEGRLTEEWRAANPQEEDGQMLLDRILRERRERWEQDQLAKFRETGKEPPKNWPSKYAAPAEPDGSELPELPEGWVWATIGGSTFVDVGYAFKSADFSTEGIRLLRGDNMEPGALRWQDARHWPEDKLPGFESLLLGVGDIVLAMDRPLISTGLKIARVRESDLPCLLVQRVARLRPMTDLTNSLLYIAMQTRRFINHLQGEQQGTQIPHISGQTIAEFSIPVPPLAEQRQIVALVEERLSQIDAAEKTINAELIRAKRLRQSILKQAFEGKLVPQDPNDEPASVLLERIKAARAAEPAKKSNRRRTSNA